MLSQSEDLYRKWINYNISEVSRIPRPRAGKPLTQAQMQEAIEKLSSVVGSLLSYVDDLITNEFHPEPRPKRREPWDRMPGE